MTRNEFSTRILISVDALGNPLHFLLAGGHRHDITQAETLIADTLFEWLIADTAYDTDPFLRTIAANGAEMNKHLDQGYRGSYSLDSTSFHEIKDFRTKLFVTRMFLKIGNENV